MPDLVEGNQPEMLIRSRSRKKKKRHAGLYVLRALIVLLSTLVLVAGLLLGMIAVIVKGPSATAKRLFVLTVKETSAAGFLADLFLSEDEIAALLQTNNADSDEETDTSLIKLPTVDPGNTSSTVTDDGNNGGEAPAADNVELVDVKGPTYHGKLMIIHDPSKVVLGVPDAFGADKYGLSLRDMLEKYDARGGINGGGFEDPNGSGTGGLPDGLVIKDGRLMWGSEGQSGIMMGFDADHILHVGYMTGKAALDAGIVEGVSFGPALIINGKPQNEGRPIGGGINPRTVIGQRADGAVLLLIIEGRQITSLGVTYDDLVDIMLSYGAVNAGNLDGGSSSLMMLDGEPVTNSAYVYGERVLATAFLVLK